jgi:hypothetical protein
MQTSICKITFSDGSWMKAELPSDFSQQAQYVYENFGMFASIESLPADDAAVRSADAKKVERVKAAVEKHTGRKLPASAVRIQQYAFRVEAFDAEDICVFAAQVSTESGELYRLGVDMHGMTLVATH